MITPFAPYRDGIANYAVQEVADMRRAGEDVTVLSPLPSAAHEHLVVGSATGMLRLLRRVGGFDRVIVQVFPELLFGACRHRIERLAVWGLWRAVAARTEVEFRIHEIDYATITCDASTRRTAVAALRAMGRRTVHTEAERRALEEAAPGAGPIELVDHGARFTPRTSLDRERARASLGLDESAFVFLSIGFVQRHKGFDRAVAAFSRLVGDHRDGIELHVVGDIRVDHPDLSRYRDELDRLIASTPGCHRRSGYVGDAEFDRWIVAADCVVLPYRNIWSSGVVERAHLFDRPVIVTDVGGLAEQAGATHVVSDDAELLRAMAEVAGVESSAPSIGVDVDRAGLERSIRRRAGTVQADGRDRVSDHLRRVPAATLAPPISGRPGVSYIKRLIHRVTSWQLQPIADVVNDLRSATTEAIEQLSGGERDGDTIGNGSSVEPPDPPGA